MCVQKTLKVTMEVERKKGKNEEEVVKQQQQN